MEKIFKALSSPVRRRILAYLSGGPLRAGDIADRFEMAWPTISRHLNVLENARLVRSQKKGLHVFYTLEKDNLVTSVYDFLADFCPVSRTLKKESRTRRTKHD
ncbi:MAG: metalloregulator ArsR/SmtB family transcription factor [Pseudomonadota bacterium]|nr:metalloregulator ArsR/SmtB family transcription factor [Pseudomonadota bacterium]